MYRNSLIRTERLGAEQSIVWWRPEAMDLYYVRETVLSPTSQLHQHSLSHSLIVAVSITPNGPHRAFYVRSDVTDDGLFPGSFRGDAYLSVGVDPRRLEIHRAGDLPDPDWTCTPETVARWRAIAEEEREFWRPLQPPVKESFGAKLARKFRLR